MRVIGVLLRIADGGSIDRRLTVAGELGDEWHLRREKQGKERVKG